MADSPENYKTRRYELSSESDGTRLTVIQDNNEPEKEARHSEQNWEMVMEGIKKVVES